MTKLCRFFPQRILAAIALTAFFVVFAGVSARSQTSGAGSINGSVMDSNQAVIPGASVTVTDTDTGVVHNYTSNGAGLYTAPFLLPGHYEVDATAPNFGKVEEKGITLLVGQTLTINLTLKVNAATTTVEVSGTTRFWIRQDRSFPGRRSESGRESSGGSAQLEHLCPADPQRHAGWKHRPDQLPRHQRPL